MRESELQEKIIKDLGGKGWLVIKLIQTNKNGIPDLLLIKNGEHIFLEIKTDSGITTELQLYRIAQLRKFGADARIIRGKKEYEKFKNDLK